MARRRAGAGKPHSGREAVAVVSPACPTHSAASLNLRLIRRIDRPHEAQCRRGFESDMGLEIRQPLQMRHTSSAGGLVWSRLAVALRSPVQPIGYPAHARANDLAMA